MKSIAELRINGFAHHSRNSDRHSNDPALRREYQAEYRCEQRKWQENGVKSSLKSVKGSIFSIITP